MTFHTDGGTEFARIRAVFDDLGIPTDAPGFYDHPLFIAQEQKDPAFLANYARFVRALPLDQTYLKRASALIHAVALRLASYLSEKNKLSACQLGSMALSRMLEGVGVWNVCMQGAFSAEIESFGQSRQVFYAYGPAIASGTVRGHAWIYAPPFYVVDVTARLQPWTFKEVAAAMSPVVVIDHPKFEPLDMTLVCDEVIIDRARARGMEFTSEMLFERMPDFERFIADFPKVSLTGGGLRLAYHPTSCGAPAEPFSELGVDVPDLDLPGFWKVHILPALGGML